MTPSRALDPLVRALLIEIDERGLSREYVCREAGLSKDVIGMWSRAHRVPNIGNMRAAFGVLGFEVVPIKRLKG